MRCKAFREMGIYTTTPRLLLLKQRRRDTTDKQKRRRLKKVIQREERRMVKWTKRKEREDAKRKQEIINIEREIKSIDRQLHATLKRDVHYGVTDVLVFRIASARVPDADIKLLRDRLLFSGFRVQVVNKRTWDMTQTGQYKACCRDEDTNYGCTVVQSVARCHISTKTSRVNMMKSPHIYPSIHYLWFVQNWRHDENSSFDEEYAEVISDSDNDSDIATE